MKKYNYTDIISINSNGIIFNDSHEVQFDECRHQWAEENNIEYKDSVCIATRLYSKKDKYFIFYTKERTMLLFKFKGIFGRRKSKNKFIELQFKLNKYGFTSFDET